MRLFPLLTASFHLAISSTNSPSNETVYYNPIFTDSIICAYEHNGEGKFKYEKCPRYASTGLLPFCVYMLVPSTATTKGYDKYGCIYGHQLPTQCLQRTKAYLPYVTLSFRGQNHTGSALCCMDNFCNEIEEPLFTLVRLDIVKTSKEEILIWPLIVAIAILAAGGAPWCRVKLAERHQISMRKLEKPAFLAKTVDGENPWQIKQVKDVYMQSMNFSSLKRMQYVAKNVIQPMRHAQNSHSGAHGLMSTPKYINNGSSPQADGECLADEDHHHEPLEFLLCEHVHVFQRCMKAPKKVARTIVSRYEYLAQRLIEHGPYRFDFDPVELGDLFDSVTNIIAQEPSLLELEPDIVIYGNIEGSYGDLFRWMHRNGWPPKRRLLFLGGLTSEAEPYSLETLTLIFALKQLMPHHVYVIRGASETYRIRLEDGRFPRRVTVCLQDIINRCFAYLPLAATIGNVFCSHGGIPANFEEIRDCRYIKRPLAQVDDGTLAAKLIFSQAGPIDGPIPGCRGVGFSSNFRPDLQSPTTGQTVTLFVRSRNSCANGYVFIGDVILNLWSATNCSPKDDGAAASLYIDRNMNGFLCKMAAYGLYSEEELKEYDLVRKRQEEYKWKLRVAAKKRKKETDIHSKYPVEATA